MSRTIAPAAVLALCVSVVAAPAALGDSWTSPDTVGSAGSQPYYQALDLSAGSAGGVTAVWPNYDGSKYIIQASRYSAGAWAAATTLSSSGDTGKKPQAVTDSSGVVTAVWARNVASDANSYTIQASRYSGGSWSAPVNLYSPSSAQGQDPQVVVDANNVVTAMWVACSGSNCTVRASRYVSGSWTLAVDVSSTLDSWATPQMAVDADGVVTAVWVRTNYPPFYVQSSRFVNGNWTIPVTLNSGAENTNTYDPDVVVDSTGVATAVWSHLGFGGARLAASRYSGGSWSSATDVTLDSSIYAFAPSAVVDSSNRVTVVFEALPGFVWSTQAIRYSGGSWSTPVTLGAMNYQTTPRAAIDSSGVVTAVWSNYTGGTSIIQASQYAGSWNAPVTIATAGPPMYMGFTPLPSVAVDSSGVPTAAWVANISGAPLPIKASRLAPPAPNTPASPTAVAGNAQATVTVAQGAGGGGTPTSYTVTAVEDNAKSCTVSGASGSCDVTGLTNGTSYTFTATATNGGGTSASSSASSAGIPLTAASAPTNLVATAHDQSVEVAFTPGTNGGSPISNYQYRLNGSGSWTAFSPSQTTSPVTISGLTNGTAYTVELRAVTGYGSPGAASSATAGVTPAGPVVAPTPTPDPTAGGTSAESQASQLSGVPAVMGPARALAMHAPHRTGQGLMVSTGHVPEGATAIVQIARTGVSSLSLDAWANARVMTKCPITGQGTSRVFACSMRLGAGTWVITTQARDGATILASSAKRVVVRATTRTAVTG